MSVSRRDFLKLFGAALATAAVPKAIIEAIPDEIETVRELPLELQIALSQRSTMRLDPLGISVSGLEEFYRAGGEQAWRDEILRRFDARLNAFDN